jgi:phage-related protein
MPFAYAEKERGLILITHGFVKKKDKTPKEEIERAWRIYKEDQVRTQLAIVKKAKR